MKLGLFLFCFALSAFAQTPYYLKPEAIDLTHFPAPPSDDTSDWQAVLNYQNQRTTADCERAMHENAATAVSFFGPPYGPLTQAQSEALIDFHERLLDEVNYFARDLKNFWKRPRPFVRDTTITPCLPAHASSFSYPSGHAAAGQLAAKTLSLIYPQHKAALMKRAKVIAEDRVVGGVHYPSDVAAGTKLADIVFNALMDVKAFRDDVDQLK